MRVNQERDEELPAAECQRMLSLVVAPLLPPHQLEAIFAAFDTNLDGEISPDELRGVLCMINPLGRPKEVQALAPKPPPPGLAEKMGDLALTVTAEEMRKIQSAAELRLNQLGLKRLGSLLATEAPPPAWGGGGGGGGGGGQEGEAEDEAEGEAGAEDGSPTGGNASVAQGLDLRRAGNMLVKALGGGTAAAGDEEDEEGAGMQQKWRRRRRVKRTAWDTNQRLAEQWQAVAPNFAYA